MDLPRSCVESARASRLRVVRCLFVPVASLVPSCVLCPLCVCALLRCVWSAAVSVALCCARGVRRSAVWIRPGGCGCMRAARWGRRWGSGGEEEGATRSVEGGRCKESRGGGMARAQGPSNQPRAGSAARRTVQRGEQWGAQRGASERHAMLLRTNEHTVSLVPAMRCAQGDEAPGRIGTRRPRPGSTLQQAQSGIRRIDLLQQGW